MLTVVPVLVEFPIPKMARFPAADGVADPGENPAAPWSVPEMKHPVPPAPENPPTKKVDLIDVPTVNVCEELTTGEQT
jgi:hypothetical protein